MKIYKEIQISDCEMRSAYVNKLIQLEKEYSNVVVIDADCMSSVGTTKFQNLYPHKHINVGIMEANAVGIASGISLTGQVPFFSTFAVFATRRTYDQIFVSAAYSKVNVKIVGWDVGISGGSNGGTHMAVEDIAIMRVIPEMTVLEASDPLMMEQLTELMYHHQGNVYLRSSRKKAYGLYRQLEPLVIGKGLIALDGRDYTIVASGIMVQKALEAANQLNERGLSIRVLDMYSIKPLDRDLIIRSAKETKGLVVVENHSIINGLGAAVKDVLIDEQLYIPIKQLGFKDVFGQVGDVEYLADYYGINSNDIVQSIMEMEGSK